MNSAVVRIKQVEFMQSAGAAGNYPDHERPEFAFAGRSNCGKSSLINTLVNRRRLARVSSTPGRTQLINFFDVDGRLVLVDLPGFGFARAPLAVRASWGPLVERYLTRRECLRALVLLLDARRDPRDDEFNLVSWCGNRDLPVIHVATKIDKLKAANRPLRLREIARAFAIPLRALVPFSSVSGEGRDELWSRLTIPRTPVL